MIDLLTGGALGAIIKGAGTIIDDLHTSEHERMQIELEEQYLDGQLAAGQMETNAVEATHRSVFVAGWRPFIGWVCGLALGYKFLGYPVLVWGWTLAQSHGWVPMYLETPPNLDAADLYPVIMGMLGLGTMRTVEGLQGKKTNSLGGAKKKGRGFLFGKRK